MTENPLLAIFLPLILLVMALPLLTLLTGNNSLARLTAALARFFDMLNRKLGGLVVWTTLLMALIQMTIVIMRYVFGVNFIWLQESIIYLFAMMFMLTGGYVLLSNEHVRVDLLYRNVSPKRRAAVDFVGTYIFLFPVCMLMLFTSQDYVMRSWEILERSTEASGIHAVFILKTLIPLFGVLMIMAGVTVAHRAAVILRPRLLSV